MQVIILAAGKSRRFIETGYSIPKPFLNIEWRGFERLMVEHVICTIPAMFKDIAVAVPPGWSVGIPDIRPVIIQNTKGPAHTVLKMIKTLDPFDCLIMDVDVLNFTNDLFMLTQLKDCGVLVNRSHDPAYSYVDALGPFTHIKEKERISEYAVQGAYFVPGHAIQEFTNCLESVIVSKQEPYISHAFDLIKAKKFSLHTTYDPIEWGTPRDVMLSGATILSEREEICSL